MKINGSLATLICTWDLTMTKSTPCLGNTPTMYASMSMTVIPGSILANPVHYHSMQKMPAIETPQTVPDQHNKHLPALNQRLPAPNQHLQRIKTLPKGKVIR